MWREGWFWEGEARLERLSKMVGVEVGLGKL